MTTKEAFNELLSNPKFQKNINASTLRSWKRRMTNGKITINAMEKALIKCGAKKKPEQWTM